MPSRITSDARYRNELRNKVEVCIDPLDLSQHPEGLVNVVTGKVVDDP